MNKKQKRKRIRKMPTSKATRKSTRQSRQVLQPKNEVSNINNLPNEMLVKIFSRLSQNELGQIARVCRRWSPVLWRKVYVEFHRSHGSQNTVTNSLVNHLPPCVTCLRLNFKNRRGWAQPLNFREFAMNLQEICPCLEMLILHGAELSISLPLIIDLCSQFLNSVTSLIFDRSRFSRPPRIMEFNGDSKIKNLDIFWCNFQFHSWSNNVNKPPFTIMPNLEELRLSSRDVDDTWFEGDTSFLNQLNILDLGRSNISSRTFHEIITNGIYLNELYLCRTYIEDNDLIFNDVMFPHLKTICLKLCDVTCEGIISLVLSCSNLQNVYVHEDVAQNYAKHPFILSNKNYSEIVKVISCYDHQKLKYLCE